MSKFNGRLFYNARPKTKEEKQINPLRILKMRRTKKIPCNDGKTRRFVNGAEGFGERYLPVRCAECGWDFGFFDIYPRTIEFLKNHTCDLSPVPMTAEEEREYLHIDQYEEPLWKKTRKDL